MTKLSPQSRSYRFLIMVTFLLVAFGPVVIAQNKLSKPSRRPGRQIRPVTKRYEPERPIALRLRRCSIKPELNAFERVFTVLDIEDERITLTDNAGNFLAGEVRAYARSAYWLDSNLGLIFGRTSIPVTDRRWKPPTIISLLLTQDHRRPKTLNLKPAEGLSADFPAITLSCESAEGSPG